MRILLLAGAGTSVELGVPAMSGLATEFLAHAKQWNVEPALAESLMGGILDVERLIESLDQICSARAPLELLGGMGETIARADTVRSEVEWFVQHAAERVAARSAHLMWGAVLRALPQHEISFITTNYDRAIELAANAEGVQLDDGFVGFMGTEIARWRGFRTTEGVFPLVKLHGSTDWYAERSSGQPLKLRHPMPLFGRGTLRLTGGQELGSALILPSREKLLTRDPYPRLSQTFLNAADRCDFALFIGSSLRDHHLRSAASGVAKDRPVFVVNRKGETFGVSGAIGIAQSSSMFLISALPAALGSDDPIAELRGVAERSSASPPEGILDLLSIAMDEKETTARRCEAIESMDRLSVSLDGGHITKLLSDPSVSVSRYALSLVASSKGQAGLVQFAKGCPHAADPQFAEELGLLDKIL